MKCIDYLFLISLSEITRARKASFSMGQVFGKNHHTQIITLRYDSSSLLAQSDPRRSRLDLRGGPSIGMVVKLLLNAFKTKTRTLCYSTRLTKDHSPAQFEYSCFSSFKSSSQHCIDQTTFHSLALWNNLQSL